jgi:hypothetical protein
MGWRKLILIIMAQTKTLDIQEHQLLCIPFFNLAILPIYGKSD